jgi:hypothetical protein
MGERCDVGAPVPKFLETSGSSLLHSVSLSLKLLFQVQTNLAESDEYQVESLAGCQASTCVCADEAQTCYWNITATKLGMSGEWQMNKEDLERKLSIRNLSFPLLCVLVSTFLFLSFVSTLSLLSK